MSPIQLSATAGPDAVLHLTIPVSGPGDYEVTVKPKSEPDTAPKRGWPPGYFQSVIGSVTDDSFVLPVRHPAKPIKPLDQE